MATLEITEKDIATVEQLHDRLWEKGDMPASLQVNARQLIARMYESVDKRTYANKKTTTVCEDVDLFFSKLIKQK